MCDAGWLALCQGVRHDSGELAHRLGVRGKRPFHAFFSRCGLLRRRSLRPFRLKTLMVRKSCGQQYLAKGAI
jgi:hypothetical protein